MEFRDPTTHLADDANEAFFRVEPFDPIYYEKPLILISRSSK